MLWRTATPSHAVGLRAFVFRICYQRSTLKTSSLVASNQPHPPLNLDPGLKALLQDVDISLKSKIRVSPQPLQRDLEEIQDYQCVEDRTLLPEELDEFDGARDPRKSPAADFGGQRIGAVVIPSELQRSIDQLISASDKPLLHSDAKRLFASSGSDGSVEWEAQYDAKYKTRIKREYLGQRDGTAFASVVLPAHYAVIYSVLDHIKRRLEPEWKVERIIDWGAGTGSALWATAYSFQKQTDSESGINEPDEPQLSRSTIVTYVGIDKRDGLTSIGKRLLGNLDIHSVGVSWQRGFREDDKIRRPEASDTLGITAFTLSSLPNAVARKALVKEMWESGANVMVLIDHNTTAGFECIAEARDYLLRVGKKEIEDPAAQEWPIRGSHVVAPCPHDLGCPLFHPGSSKLPCGFSQRLQRPGFVRRTKHSGVGHEDVTYSYVVIRRGLRPAPALTQVGRVGGVGKDALNKEAAGRVPKRELILHSDHTDGNTEAEHGSELSSVEETPTTQLPSELQEALRREAYGWPRLVFPPLKRSGHIIIDGCTTEGKIMRMTIPRSQGKQAYYDARKSHWGDIFPHAPKNTPQERYQPTRAKREGGTSPTKGADIGKRRKADKMSKRSERRSSYDVLSKEIKESNKQMSRKLARERSRDLDVF